MVTEFPPDFYVFGTENGVESGCKAHSLLYKGAWDAECLSYESSGKCTGFASLGVCPTSSPTRGFFPTLLLKYVGAKPLLPLPSATAIDELMTKAYHKERMARLRCWLCGVLGIGAIVSLSFASVAQGCSISESAAGLCADGLLFQWSIGTEERAPVLTVARLEPPRISVPDLPDLHLAQLLRSDRTDEEVEAPSLLWEFGTVGELEARLQDLDELIRTLLEDFFREQGTRSLRELTVIFNLDGPTLLPLPTQLEGRSSLRLDERWRLLLNRATVTLRTELGPGKLLGEIELDPQTLQVSKEKIALEVSLGATALSGATTFERGLGLTHQIYTIRAQVGGVQLTGQATFSPAFQEFKIGASIAGLALTGSSVIGPGGITTQSLFIEIPIKGR